MQVRTELSYLRVVSEQWEITAGASTCIFRLVNSNANMGFDSITDKLRFSSLSIKSRATDSTELQLLHSRSSLSSLMSPLLEESFVTFTGLTARILFR